MLLNRIKISEDEPHHQGQQGPPISFTGDGLDAENISCKKK